MSEKGRQGRAVRLVLVLLPTFLLLSAAGAVWLYWKKGTEDEPHPGLALGASELGDEELRDTLRKLAEYIGPRDWETPEGRRSMRQAIAFLSGTLSPRNYGYAVRSGGEMVLVGERWPTVWVDVAGSGSGTVIVAVPYDGDHVSMAAVLGLAGELREAELRRTVRFAFYPAEIWAGVDGPAAAVLGAADRVLCVHELGAGRDLWSIGPSPAGGEVVLREVVDGHSENPDQQGEAVHFARLSERVWEVRGRMPGERESGATEGDLVTEGRKVDDLRARVGRLEKIVRGLANSE